MIQLLTRGFAGFYRPIDQLRAFGHGDFGCITFEVVTTGARDGACGHEHAWTGNVTFIDRLLDSHIAVACALGLHVADGGEALLERPAYGDHCTCRAVGGRELEQLNVVAAGGGNLTL